jgi:hypothetical protein
VGEGLAISVPGEAAVLKQPGTDALWAVRAGRFVRNL